MPTFAEQLPEVPEPWAGHGLGAIRVYVDLQDPVPDTSRICKVHVYGADPMASASRVANLEPDIRSSQFRDAGTEEAELE